jgi:hypothetical protein
MLDAWSRVRADCRYKLGRQLMYGRLEDGKSFTGVRRLVQQEDYALRLVRYAGLPSGTGTIFRASALLGRHRPLA